MLRTKGRCDGGLWTGVRPHQPSIHLSFISWTPSFTAKHSLAAEICCCGAFRWQPLRCGCAAPRHTMRPCDATPPVHRCVHGASAVLVHRSDGNTMRDRCPSCTLSRLHVQRQVTVTAVGRRWRGERRRLSGDHQQGGACGGAWLVRQRAGGPRGSDTAAHAEPCDGLGGRGAGRFSCRLPPRARAGAPGALLSSCTLPPLLTPSARWV